MSLLLQEKIFFNLAKVVLAGCTAILLSACATQTKIATLDPKIRQVVLSPSHCADAFPRVERVIGTRADTERGAYQLRATPGVDRFDTSLFERWADGAMGWWHTYTHEGYRHLTPHILNYDLLGDMYYYGCPGKQQNVIDRVWNGKLGGVPVDKELAAKHYEFAAIGHVADSQFKLGKMLFEGDGIHADTETGINWLTSAALEGNKEAREYLAKIGIEGLPPASFPNTFQRMAQWERQMQQMQLQAIAARQQQIRANWANFAMISLVAVGAYYSGAAMATPPVTSNNRTQARLQPTPKINIIRSQPVFCRSRVNLSVVGSDYAPFVNGTIRTFCH